MLAAFFANVAQAFTDPRGSARALLSRGPDMQQATLMAALAFCLHVIGGLLTGLALDGAFPASNPVMRMGNLGLQLLQFLILTFGAHAVCAKFGGTANRVQIAALTGWHSVVNSFLAPLQLLALGAVETPDQSLLVLLLPLTLGVSVWIYSAFLAEANGFKKLGPVVLGVVLGFVFLGAVMQVALAAVIGPEALTEMAG